jgi:hypothetical protein
VGLSAECAAEPLRRRALPRKGWLAWGRGFIAAVDIYPPPVEMISSLQARFCGKKQDNCKRL